MTKRIVTCVLCLLLLFADGNIVKASEVDAQYYESETDAENLACDDGMTQLQNARSYNPYVDTRYMSLSGYIYVNVVMPDGGLSIYKVDCSVPYNDYAGSQQITYTMQLVSGVDLGATLKDSSYYTKSDGGELVYPQFQASSKQYIFPFSMQFSRNLPGYHMELVGVFGNENGLSSMTGYGANWVSFDTDTNDNGMTNYTDDKAFRHATYTVQYVPNKYTLTLNSNGGTYNSMAWNVSFPLTYATGDYDRIGCPKRTGYLFHGWFDGEGTQIYDANGDALPCTYWSNYGASGYYQYTGDLTVYAYWTPITYYISYNGNGSTDGTTGVSSHTYDTVSKLTANGFARAGYTFAGWNTKADGSGTAYNDKASISNLITVDGQTITLYAQWRLNPVTVSVPRSLILNQDGDGSFVIKADNETGTVTVNVDNTINLTQKGKDQVLAGIVSFDRNTLTPDRHEIKGSINTESLSAGSWKGVLNLNITFKL